MLFLSNGNMNAERTSGYVSWIGNYADKDAALVEILYECGAVPFVQTNVPQTLMVRNYINVMLNTKTNVYVLLSVA